jgi:hypothetical protein
VESLPQIKPSQETRLHLASKSTSSGANIDAGEMDMRTTVNLDDALLERARFLTGIEETGPLIKAALTAMIQRESARRLARLAGSQPTLEDIPRRRSEPSKDYASLAEQASEKVSL